MPKGSQSTSLGVPKRRSSRIQNQQKGLPKQGEQQQPQPGPSTTPSTSTVPSGPPPPAQQPQGRIRVAAYEPQDDLNKAHWALNTKDPPNPGQRAQSDVYQANINQNPPPKYQQQARLNTNPSDTNKWLNSYDIGNYPTSQGPSIRNQLQNHPVNPDQNCQDWVLGAGEAVRNNPNVSTTPQQNANWQKIQSRQGQYQPGTYTPGVPSEPRTHKSDSLVVSSDSNSQRQSPSTPGSGPTGGQPASGNQPAGLPTQVGPSASSTPSDTSMTDVSHEAVTDEHDADDETTDDVASEGADTVVPEDHENDNMEHEQHQCEGDHAGSHHDIEGAKHGGEHDEEDLEQNQHENRAEYGHEHYHEEVEDEYDEYYHHHHYDEDEEEAHVEEGLNEDEEEHEYDQHVSGYESHHHDGEEEDEHNDELHHEHYEEEHEHFESSSGNHEISVY